MSDAHLGGEWSVLDGWEAALVIALRPLGVDSATAGLVVGALRSLPVEQRMEAMGMRPVEGYAEAVEYEGTLWMEDDQ